MYYEFNICISRLHMCSTYVYPDCICVYSDSHECRPTLWHITSRYILVLGIYKYMYTIHYVTMWPASPEINPVVSYKSNSSAAVLEHIRWYVVILNSVFWPLIRNFSDMDLIIIIAMATDQTLGSNYSWEYNIYIYIHMHIFVSQSVCKHARGITSNRFLSSS